MPCNSDYLEPNARERHLQQTAQLYQWALHACRRPIPPEVEEAARDSYCKADFVAELCGFMRSRNSDARRMLLTSPNQSSAKLNLWWIEHQAADAAREARDTAEFARAELKRQALAKLTPEERKVLGH